jgi:hypothetical protein
MDELRLIEKLRLIEALFSGAATEGERVAAERARERILERLKIWEKEDPPLEYRFTMRDMWSRKVLVALLRRYGIRPYRYKRQRYTTVMAKVSKKFVDETLWPEFQEISETLRTYLSEVTNRVVSEVIHQDSSEAEVVEEPSQLPLSTVPPMTEASRETDNTSQQAPQKGPDVTESMSPSAEKTPRNQKKRKRKKKRKRR